MHFCPVILAGGTGTRLWPLSRELMPKQFLPIVGEKTLFQDTLLRANALCGDVAPLIVCNDAHYFFCQDQLADINMADVQFLLEPVPRNTASAVALAALFWQDLGEGDTPMLIMPADHLLADKEHLKACLMSAVPFAKAGRLVTFGVHPTKPETGYGYIEMGESLDEQVFQVKRFVEKPNRDTAEHYIAAGHYVWNSGLFLVTPNVYLDELKQYQPEVLSHATQGFREAHVGNDYRRIHQTHYESCPNISIDYAVMEKSDQVVVVLLKTHWSDLGCWAAVSESHASDDQDNVLIGDVIAQHSHDCYLNAQDNRLIAAIGLSHMMVVSTADAILVADKQYAQEVKTLVKKLKDENHSSVTTHRRVYRPWGYYESLVAGSHYQVKHIMVKPNARLSLQKHQHRAEHWVVVRGVADVVNDDVHVTLHANQSTYIPKGAVHRLSNSGTDPLHVIEVQSGDYLGEDDIVRLQDDYERVL